MPGTEIGPNLASMMANAWNSNGSTDRLRHVAEMFGMDVVKATVINMLKCIAAQLEDEKKAIVDGMGAAGEAADAGRVAHQRHIFVLCRLKAMASADMQDANSSDPQVLLVLRLADKIHGETRVQKYSFLIHKEHGRQVKPIGFYDDWTPYHYGPYSFPLKADFVQCVRSKDIKRSGVNTYSLTEQGRIKSDRLIAKLGDLGKIRKMIGRLQSKSLHDIIEEVYHDYPDYAIKSKIRRNT